MSTGSVFIAGDDCVAGVSVGGTSTLTSLPSILRQNGHNDYSNYFDHANALLYFQISTVLHVVMISAVGCLATCSESVAL